MTLFLKDEDVAQCVTMDAMLEAIESMQHEYGDGQAHNMTRRNIIAESGSPPPRLHWRRPRLFHRRR